MISGQVPWKKLQTKVLLMSSPVNKAKGALKEKIQEPPRTIPRLCGTGLLPWCALRRYGKSSASSPLESGRNTALPAAPQPLAVYSRWGWRYASPAKPHDLSAAEPRTEDAASAAAPAAAPAAGPAPAARAARRAPRPGPRGRTRPTHAGRRSGRARPSATSRLGRAATGQAGEESSSHPPPDAFPPRGACV